MMVEGHAAQVIPTTEKETRSNSSVSLFVATEFRGWSDATSASYPMSCIVSSMSPTIALSSKMAVAEWPRSETDTSCTPDRWDRASVMAVTHDAQVIPPTESVR